MSSSQARPTKRQRAFGAPTEDDDPTARLSQGQYKNAVSTRSVGGPLPTLATYCARAFVRHIGKLSADQNAWEAVLGWLKLIPEPLVPKLFAMLKTAHPTLLRSEFIVCNFMRGRSLSLTGDLPGVGPHTIQSISRMSPSLIELRLNGFSKISDEILSSTISSLPLLELLDVSECSKVGILTVEEIKSHCLNLLSLDLSHTSVTPVSLAGVLQNCRKLETLKVAGIKNWTDATFEKLTAVLAGVPLPNIRKLKFSQLQLFDGSIAPFLDLCRNLRSLDVSFTFIKNPHKYLVLEENVGANLEKLDMSCTPLTSSSLLAMVKHLSGLRKVVLGAMGSTGSTAGWTSATMTNETLDKLTTTFMGFQRLETVSLVGNVKLGFSSTRSFRNFIAEVGRRCKKLNMSSLSHLKSSDLEPLFPSEFDPSTSPLQVLILNNTGIGDDAAPFIGSCEELETLGVASTKFTTSGIFAIIELCKKLQNLDVTSCRQIPILDRRRMFEGGRYLANPLPILTCL
ncbi:RNI-like protein [Thelephora ganbajun]|uniref:RNI-like protein n=1 Tax=Thelephora ganbajun TaxID=370292 RepID=A0ACB6ZXX0_THEGA|nr:RNI-like protein [Thelephora ganbajun]